jgi:hypothetical protein
MVTSDEVIGLHMFGDFDWMPPPVDVMSRDRFWHGPWLVIPPPSSTPNHDPATAKRASGELNQLLGTPFNRDLTPFIETFNILAFPVTHQLPGPREMVFQDRPGVTYTWLTLAFDQWRVQALGAPGDFYFISIFTTLDADTALDTNGLPHKHPVGNSRELLTRLAPALTHQPLQVDTRYETNLYDMVLTTDRIRVRMGVRAAHHNGRPTGEYLYVARIDTKAVK